MALLSVHEEQHWYLKYMINPLDPHYSSKTQYDEDIKSPCVRNCCLDDYDVCVGCGRTLEEILIWGSAEPDEKRRILNRISQHEASGTPSLKEKR